MLSKYKNHKMDTLKFILMYFISYLAFSFCMTNFTPYLSSLGYDAMHRGWMLSGYAIMTILFQLVFGFLSDKFQAVKKIILLSLFVFGISSMLLFQDKEQIFILQFVLIALSGGLINSLCGLFDTWILGIDEQMKESLSFIKAFGSIGWAVGSVTSSYIILQLSYAGIGWSVFVFAVLVILNMVSLPDIKKSEKHVKVRVKDALTLFRIPQYSILVLILFLLYAMVIANNCTVIDKMISFEATNFQISLKWALGSLLEIPTYLAGAYLLKKCKAIQLLQVSSVVMILQFLLFAIANRSETMIFISILQVFSTPIILITSKVLIYELSPVHLRNSSQLIALSIFMGCSSFIIPSFAGFLSVQIGYDSTLMSMCLLGIVAFVLIALLKRMNKEKDVRS